MSDYERHVREIAEEDGKLSSFVEWRGNKELSEKQVEQINKNIDRGLDDRRLLMVFRDSAKVLEETDGI